MPSYTTNYSLYKPHRDDMDTEVDTSLSDNFTKIDAEIKNRANDISELNGEMADIETNKLDKTGGTISGDIKVTGTDGNAKPVIDVLSTDTGKQGIFVKQQATGTVTTHALTAYQASTDGFASGINCVSDNKEFSSMQVTGSELHHGTIKVSHKGQADGSDASSSGLSIDLKTSGTAAQGIFITATEGATTGNLMNIRNNGREDFVIKGTGRVGVGTPIGKNPDGVMELVQNDDTTPALVVRGRDTGTNMMEFRRPSDGAIRTRISNLCQIVSQETAYFTGNGIMIGSSSTEFGEGSGGMVGIKNATLIPSLNPVGGIVLYVENDVLKYRKPDGTIVVLDGI